MSQIYHIHRYLSLKLIYQKKKKIIKIYFIVYRTNIEETYSKLLGKLAKQSSGTANTGTFNPLWQLLRSSIEKLTTLHIQMVHKVCELVKDVTKYTDELHKKHKNVSLTYKLTFKLLIIFKLYLYFYFFILFIFLG